MPVSAGKAGAGASRLGTAPVLPLLTNVNRRWRFHSQVLSNQTSGPTTTRFCWPPPNGFAGSAGRAVDLRFQISGTAGMSTALSLIIRQSFRRSLQFRFRLRIVAAWRSICAREHQVFAGPQQRHIRGNRSDDYVVLDSFRCLIGGFEVTLLEHLRRGLQVRLRHIHVDAQTGVLTDDTVHRPALWFVLVRAACPRR